MKQRKAAFRYKFRSDLLAPPHIVDKLFRLVEGEWQPALAQEEQLVAHLTECRYCRTVLIVLLSTEQEYERSNPSPESSVQDLLTRFVKIHHEIEAQDFEHMGAYAETIVTEGRQEADKRFPILAEHVKRCPGCQTWLEETLAFLNEPEETH